MCSSVSLLLAAPIWLVQAGEVIAQREPLIERLDPPTRARVVLALVGLVMLGVLMIGITWLVFRMIRGRIRDHRRIVEKQRRRAIDADDWAKKPLAAKFDETGDA